MARRAEASGGAVLHPQPQTLPEKCRFSRITLPEEKKRHTRHHLITCNGSPSFVWFLGLALTLVDSDVCVHHLPLV